MQRMGVERGGDGDDGEFIEVKYDGDYTGGSHSGVGNQVYNPAALVNLIGVERSFMRASGISPVHLVSYTIDGTCTRAELCERAREG